MWEDRNKLAANISLEATLPSLLMARAEGYGDETAWEWDGGEWTFQEWRDQVVEWAQGWIEKGLAVGDRVVLSGPPSAQLLGLDLAVMAAGGVSILLSNQLTEDQAKKIAAEAKPAWVIQEKGPGLTVDWEELGSWTEKLKPSESDSGELEMRSLEIESNHPAAVVYSSGDKPKGAVYRHHHILAAMQAAIRTIEYQEGDRILSCDPGASIERVGAVYVPLALGLATILDRGPGPDLARWKPDFFFAPSSWAQNLKGKLAERCTEKAFSRILFWWGQNNYETLHEHFELAMPLAFWERPLFHFYKKNILPEIAGEVGDRLRFVITYGENLPKTSITFFQALDLAVYQSYSLAEIPIAAVNTLTHNQLGTSGRLVPGVQGAVGQGGEILLTGKQIAQDYIDESLSDQAFDPAGRFRTGDVGEMDADGYLQIEERASR